jgi:probable 2-oxoglutarate dehydrogenase E1 component DHKTD1
LSGKSEFPPGLKYDWASGDVISHIPQVKQLSNSSLTAILLPNPSHLEAINPVALGVSRARLDCDASRKVLSLQLHGDAAFSGQGVVYESLALSNLPGFSVNGTIHIVVNNQLGFTTEPKNGRSTLYATDIAKSINAPILRVNAAKPNVICFD